MTRRCFAAACLAAAPLFGADFSGRWEGPMKLKRPDGAVVDSGTAYLDLKQSGGVVTGRAGRGDANSTEIVNGRANGDTLTFQARESQEAPLMDIKLVLNGGELAGDVTVEIDGQRLVAELRFKRV